jgi:L-ribulose-5-phosphate 4-epimerase
MLLPELRESVLCYAQQMLNDRLVSAREGNVSALDRESGLLAITPSAVEYTTMTPEDIVVLNKDGETIEGHYAPTSEYPMHTLLYRRRPDIGAVIHSHAPMATVFAATYETMPLVLTESAGTIGHPVKVAPYTSAGSAELGEICLEVMGDDGTAVLMGSHGLLVVGRNLANAYSSTHGVEDNARVVLCARASGATPHVISDDLVGSMHEAWLAGYRQDDAAE